jgi:segregation and condensation protein A
MADEQHIPNSELKTENSKLETPSSQLEADSSQLNAEPSSSGSLALDPDPGSPANSLAGVVDPGPSSSQPFRLESQQPPAPEEPRKPAAKKDPEEASQSPFNVTVGQVYDGPFDLLLDLIRKQNIDIYDIPIARITAQFLEYTRHLQQTDVDSAGEFVYTASLLIHIKSRMLLPRDPQELDLGNAEDPRRELIERLLEHERFKAAAQMLQQKQMVEEATWTQPGMKDFLREQGLESADEEREIAADTTDLVRVFQDILNRLRDRPVHNIDEDTVTVGQMIDFVKRRLTMEDRPISLRKLLANTRSERALICTFLAMLELVRLQAILLRQAEGLGDILIKKAQHFDQVMADDSSVRDDWS